MLIIFLLGGRIMGICSSTPINNNNSIPGSVRPPCATSQASNPLQVAQGSASAAAALASPAPQQVASVALQRRKVDTTWQNEQRMPYPPVINTAQFCDRDTLLSFRQACHRFADLSEAEQIKRLINSLKEAKLINTATEQDLIKKSLDELKHWLTTQALHAVVEGQEEDAKKYLMIRPECLLDNRATVTDFSGREIAGLTPFQAALAGGDLEMCDMMKREFFDKKPRGQAEIIRQFDEVFPGPSGGSSQERLDRLKAQQEQEAQDFALKFITPIFEKLASRATPAADVQSALDKAFDTRKELHELLDNFRMALDAKSKGDAVFNPHYLLQAFKLYDEYFDRLYAAGGQNWARCDLAWRQVVGYVQRYLPACYAQAFAQGLYDIVANDASLKRSFNFTYGRGAIFPLPPSSALGFDWGAVVAWPMVLGPGARRCAWSGAARWRTYVEQKQQAFCRLLSGPGQRQSLRIGA